MDYQGHALGQDLTLSITREGLRLGSRFLDFADLEALRPVNHRVFIDTASGESIEVSMLGFSFDGFWKELCDCFGARSLEALFVEEKLVMRAEGDYETPSGRGRAYIDLYDDAVCILPETADAVRIPLCFAQSVALDGYQITIRMADGTQYRVGRMGYDTKPFAERAQERAETVKKQRAAALAVPKLQAPFTCKGLFRTVKPDQHWQAAFGKGVCALELFTGEDAATYLYRFSGTQAQFLGRLEWAMEAMGPHREIIWMQEAQLADKPVYRMALRRCPAAAALRASSAGRIIHTANHDAKLREFLAGG